MEKFNKELLECLKILHHYGEMSIVPPKRVLNRASKAIHSKLINKALNT